MGAQASILLLPARYKLRAKKDSSLTKVAKAFCAAADKSWFLVSGGSESG